MLVVQVKFKLYVTGAIARSFAYFGRGTGSILLDQVACNGTETRLVNCRSNPLGIHDCSHSEDAGVTCKGMHACLCYLTCVLSIQLFRTPWASCYRVLRYNDDDEPSISHCTARIILCNLNRAYLYMNIQGCGMKCLCDVIHVAFFKNLLEIKLAGRISNM